MRNVKKIVGNQYLIFPLVLLMTFLFLNVKIPEYQRQYLDDSEILRIGKRELVEQPVKGMVWKSEGYWLIQNDIAEFEFRLSFLKKCKQIEIYVNELSEKDINGYAQFSEDEMLEFKITKGSNIIQMDDFVDKSSVKLVFLQAEGAKINLEYISFITTEFAELRFPWNLWLFCSLLLWIFYYNSRNFEKNKYIVYGIALLVFLLIYLQNKNVFFYFDDFGYRSLTYRNLAGTHTIRDGLDTIFEFLKNHYLYWGGRILYFFIGIILMQNIAWIRFAEALIITGIVYLCYRIVAKKRETKTDLFAAIMPLLCYMMFERELMADSAYWYTAAVLYVFPLFFVFIGMILYHDICFNEESILINVVTKRKKILTVLMLFVAAFSQEQIASAMVAMVFAVTVEYAFKYRKIGKMQLFANISVWIGFLLLLFCPGNTVRMDNSQNNSFIGNIGTVLNVLGADNQKNITLVFVISAIVCCIFLGKKAKRNFDKICDYILAVVLFGLIMIMIWYQVGFIAAIQVVLSYVYPAYKKISAYIIQAVLFCAILVQVLRWYIFCRKKLFYCYLIGGALVILLVACVSPSVAIRAILPYYLLIIPYFTDVFVQLAEGVRHKKYECIVNVTFVFLCGVAVLNYQYILLGYHKNAIVEEANIDKLTNYADYVAKEGGIQLYEHSNDAFGNVMPYMNSYEWVEGYIRNDYSIPAEWDIIWNSYNDFVKMK